MNTAKLITVILLTFFYSNTFSQSLQVLQAGTKTSLRGLSVVSDQIIWASGSNGSVAKSTDGGINWHWQVIKGYEKRDFRDIEAFDSNTAIIMVIAEPAVILKTKDGGNNWYTVFENSTKGMFLDAMSFDNKETSFGLLIGDPLNHEPFFATTQDQGEHWEIIKSNPNKGLFNMPEGEAFFASSGTNIKGASLPHQEFPMFFAVTGGKESRLIDLFSCRIAIPIPLIKGKESTGANSIDFFISGEKAKGVIVGGDFANDKDTTGNCVLLNFRGRTLFSHPQNPPHGYRSCVIYINENQLITCGTSGIDISNDGGDNWQLISSNNFHVVQKAKQGNAVFLAGNNGRIAKLVW